MNKILNTITLLTDFGSSTQYVMRIKAALLANIGNHPVLDINHNIKINNISQAMYMLDNVRKVIKSSAIHLFGVNAAETKHIAAYSNNHWYLAPNNGVLPELLANENPIFYDIGFCNHPLFVERFYVQMVKLILEDTFTQKYPQTLQPSTAIFNNYSQNGNQLKVFLAYHDVFGNCVLKIKRDAFYKIIGNNKFTIFLNESDGIDSISEFTYHPYVASLYAYFNSAGYLEISYGAGNAARMFGFDDLSYVIIMIHT